MLNIVRQSLDDYLQKNYPIVARIDNFYYLSIMKRRILTYGGYFEAFMNTLKEKEQEKIQ